MKRTQRTLAILTVLALLGHPAAAGAQSLSSWNPTLLVNTEAFQIIEDSDTAADPAVRFGQNLRESLLYDRNAAQFRLSRALAVGGNLSATGSLNVSGAMSGRTLQVTGTGASPLILARDGKVGIGTSTLGSAGLAVMNGNVGIGTTGPAGKLEIRHTADDQDGILLSSTQMTDHGMTGITGTDTYFRGTTISNALGGAQFFGLSGGDQAGLRFTGIIGSADPADTTAATVFRSGKQNATGWQALGNLETAFQFLNYSTNLISILGNGNVGIGTTAPETKLEVVGTLSGSLVTASAPTGSNYFMSNVAIGTASASKKLHVSATDQNAAVYIERVDDSTGPAYMHFKKTTASPAITDYIGIMQFDSTDSEGNATTYANITGYSTGVTDTAEEGAIAFNVFNAGTFAETMRMKGGNVGIGTTAPETKLEVVGTMSGRLLQITGTGASPLLLAKDGKVGIGTSTLGSAGLTVMNGNVGIGTTNPSKKLEVSGTFASNALWTDVSTNVSWGNYPTANGVLSWGAGYASIYATSGNFLTFGANGMEGSMAIDSTGNVGISTLTPETMLEVMGTMSGSAVYGKSINASASAATGSVIIGQAGMPPVWKAPTSAMVWYIDGTIATGTSQSATIYMPYGFTATDVDLNVDTAPTGTALIVDIHKDGVTIFSTRPQINAGSTTEAGTHAFSVTNLNAGSKITLDVDQVGSTVAGADLTVILKGTRKY